MTNKTVVVQEHFLWIAKHFLHRSCKSVIKLKLKKDRAQKCPALNGRCTNLADVSCILFSINYLKERYCPLSPWLPRNPLIDQNTEGEKQHCMQHTGYYKTVWCGGHFIFVLYLDYSRFPEKDVSLQSSRNVFEAFHNPADVWSSFFFFFFF